MLVEYVWYGNVCELKNVMECVCLLVFGLIIIVDDLLFLCRFIVV